MSHSPIRSTAPLAWWTVLLAFAGDLSLALWDGGPGAGLWVMLCLGGLCALAALAWFWVSYCNVRRLNREHELLLSRPWALVGWLLPGLNVILAVPLAIGLWRASTPRSAPQPTRSRGTWLVLALWVLNVAGNVAGLLVEPPGRDPSSFMLVHTPAIGYGGDGYVPVVVEQPGQRRALDAHIRFAFLGFALLNSVLVSVYVLSVSRMQARCDEELPPPVPQAKPPQGKDVDSPKEIGPEPEAADPVRSPAARQLRRVALLVVLSLVLASLFALRVWEARGPSARPGTLLPTERLRRPSDPPRPAPPRQGLIRMPELPAGDPPAEQREAWGGPVSATWVDLDLPPVKGEIHARLGSLVWADREGLNIQRSDGTNRRIELPGEVRSLALSPGRALVSFRGVEELWVIDLQTGVVVGRLPMAGSGDVAVDPSEPRRAYFVSPGSVAYVDALRGVDLGSFEPTAPASLGARPIVFGPLLYNSERPRVLNLRRRCLEPCPYQGYATVTGALGGLVFTTEGVFRPGLTEQVTRDSPRPLGELPDGSLLCEVSKPWPVLVVVDPQTLETRRSEPLGLPTDPPRYWRLLHVEGTWRVIAIPAWGRACYRDLLPAEGQAPPSPPAAPARVPPAEVELPGLSRLERLASGEVLWWAGAGARPLVGCLDLSSGAHTLLPLPQGPLGTSWNGQELCLAFSRQLLVLTPPSLEARAWLQLDGSALEGVCFTPGGEVSWVEPTGARDALVHRVHWQQGQLRTARIPAARGRALAWSSGERFRLGAVGYEWGEHAVVVVPTEQAPPPVPVDRLVDGGVRAALEVRDQLVSVSFSTPSGERLGSASFEAAAAADAPKRSLLVHSQRTLLVPASHPPDRFLLLRYDTTGWSRPEAR